MKVVSDQIRGEREREIGTLFVEFSVKMTCHVACYVSGRAKAGVNEEAE